MSKRDIFSDKTSVRKCLKGIYSQIRVRKCLNGKFLLLLIYVASLVAGFCFRTH